MIRSVKSTDLSSEINHLLLESSSRRGLCAWSAGRRTAGFMPPRLVYGIGGFEKYRNSRWLSNAVYDVQAAVCLLVTIDLYDKRSVAGPVVCSSRDRPN